MVDEVLAVLVVLAVVVVVNMVVEVTLAVKQAQWSIRNTMLRSGRGGQALSEMSPPVRLVVAFHTTAPPTFSTTTCRSSATTKASLVPGVQAQLAVSKAPLLLPRGNVAALQAFARYEHQLRQAQDAAVGRRGAPAHLPVAGADSQHKGGAAKAQAVDGVADEEQAVVGVGRQRGGLVDEAGNSHVTPAYLYASSTRAIS